MDDNAPTLRPRRVVSEAPPLSGDDVRAQLRVAHRRLEELEGARDRYPSSSPSRHRITFTNALLLGLAAIVAAGGGFAGLASIVREYRLPDERLRALEDRVKSCEAETGALKLYARQAYDAQSPRWDFIQAALCKAGYRDSLSTCDAVAWEQRALPAGNKLKLAPEWVSREYWKKLPEPPR